MYTPPSLDKFNPCSRIPPIPIPHYRHRSIPHPSKQISIPHPPCSHIPPIPIPPPHTHRHQSTYSSACYDLLEGLLCLDPAQRLSAKAALDHEVGRN